ncbi:hypothetical protein [Streptosporangium sp. NPDC051022]|uniref:HNH endonuclease n=1 Tax=Streptosporangium sp. NPDC051022 TaxID=3155752 RepID=UPI003446BA52
MSNAYWQDKTSRRSAPRPKGWKKIRERIIRRDNGVCQWIDHTGHMCGTPGRNVDHKVPAHLGGTDDDTNLWLLCDPHERHKTATEAGQASAAKRIPKRRPSEKHPGLL